MNLDILKRSSYWYLASPYSHKHPYVRDNRAFIVNEVSAKLMAAGVFVYSPIWATHRAAVNHSLPTEYEWWINFNKAFIDPSCGILVADMDGWQQSRGVCQEVDYGRSIGKPLLLLRCDDMSVETLT